MTTILRTDPISVDMTDASGFRRILIYAALSATGTTELIWDGAVFAANYVAASTRTAITNGYRFHIVRAGGWPAAAVTSTVLLTAIATDTFGNETTSSVTETIEPAAVVPAAAMVGYDATIEAIRTRLAGVAVTSRGEGKKSPTSVPPRLVFTWVGMREVPGNRALGSGNPRHVQTDGHEVRVEIWGRTVADCELLRAALFTAIRTQMRGRRYEDLGTVPEGEGAKLAKGMKFTVSLRLYIALPEVRMAALPTAAPGSLPTDTVIPATFPTATIETITNDPQIVEH